MSQVLWSIRSAITNQLERLSSLQSFQHLLCAVSLEIGQNGQTDHFKGFFIIIDNLGKTIVPHGIFGEVSEGTQVLNCSQNGQVQCTFIESLLNLFNWHYRKQGHRIHEMLIKSTKESKEDRPLSALRPKVCI